MIAAPRGHWPRGRRRNPITPRGWERLRAAIAAILPDAPRHGRLSRRALARYLGVSDRTVRRWLDGTDYPSAEYLPGLRAWLRAEKRFLGH